MKTISLSQFWFAANVVRTHARLPQLGWGDAHALYNEEYKPAVVEENYQARVVQAESVCGSSD